MDVACVSASINSQIGDLVMGVPHSPGRYVADLRQARIDLASAMASLNDHRFAPDARKILPDATLVTLTAAAAVVTGPLLLVGLTIPLLRAIWAQGSDDAKEKTYYGALRLIEITEKEIDKLKDDSLQARLGQPHLWPALDRRWDAVSANLTAIQCLIDSLERAGRK